MTPAAFLERLPLWARPVLALARRWVPPLVLVVSLAFMARLLVGQAPAIAADLRSADWRPAALAFGLLLVSNVVAGLIWRCLLAAVGSPVSARTAVVAWVLSSAAKYGLGAFTQYGSRLYLSGPSTSRRSAVVAIGAELVLIAYSGVVLLLAVGPMLAGAAALPVIGGVGALGAGGPVLALLLAAAFPVVGGRLIGGRSAPGHLALALGCAFANWLLNAGALWLLLGAFGPADLWLFPASLAAMVVAMLGGLVAIAPFGLGVREALLAVLLGPQVGLAAATSAGLVLRAWTVGAELVAGLGGLALRATAPELPTPRAHDTAAHPGVEAEPT